MRELLALGHSGTEHDVWLICIHDDDKFSSSFIACEPKLKDSCIDGPSMVQSRCGYASPALFCNTWPRSLALLCLPVAPRALNVL
ncbi:hypothetical protein IWX87_002268 [Polaromonas sp. CG_9.7]|nr:hypothetical protein [Polaromonas sp. CG_9.7]MBG6114509.1 hypothetical protein [Polaromonas sp. CG_9.2]MDH6185461.1 hypothetical protein [Polaromonas sp. CG_23.6]